MGLVSHPLRRASRVRHRRLAIGALVSPLLFGLAVLLLQGSTFGNGDERVRADPLGGRGVEAELPAPPQRNPDEPRRVRTFQIVASPDLLTAPVGVVACAQPPVGAWAQAPGPDRGCAAPVPAAFGPDRAATPSPAEPAASSDIPLQTASLSTSESGPVSTAAASNVAATSFDQDGRIGDAASEPVPAPAQAPSGAPRTAPVRITGRWMPSSGCSRRGGKGDCVPLVIDASGAKAAGAVCRFADKKQMGNRFAILAQCVDGAESWTSHVKLVVAGNRMTWSSERGAQNYVR